MARICWHRAAKGPTAEWRIASNSAVGAHGGASAERSSLSLLVNDRSCQCCMAEHQALAIA
eukprot:4644397-Heterocapsa_arctica.AAC.1